MGDLTDRLRANESNYFMGHLFTQAADRIDELEAALRDVMGHCARAHACDHFSIDYAKKVLDE